MQPIVEDREQEDVGVNNFKKVGLKSSGDGGSGRKESESIESVKLICSENFDDSADYEKLED